MKNIPQILRNRNDPLKNSTLPSMIVKPNKEIPAETIKLTIAKIKNKEIGIEDIETTANKNPATGGYLLM